MKRIDIKLHFTCNNHCKFCVIDDFKKKTPSKSKEEVFMFLKTAYKEGAREVIFTGGEPTIYPYILEIVNKAKVIGYKIIHIQTNGRRFYYNEFCQKIINAGANFFSISIHGPNAETHDFLTSVSGAYEQTGITR